MLRDRLPNEKNSSIPMATRNWLLQQPIVHSIANKIANKVGRPLSQIELTALISHIRKLDGVKYSEMPQDEATTRIADTYIAYTATTADVVYDTHEIMKQYLGGDVQVSPDRFMIKKDCGTIGGLTPDQDSVRQVGGHIDAYAMWPRVNVEGMAAGPAQNMGSEGLGMPTRELVASLLAQNAAQQAALAQATALLPGIKKKPLVASAKTKEEEDYLLVREGRDSNVAGVPLAGEYIQKNGVIKTRRTSVYALMDSRYRVRSTDPSTFLWSLSSSPSDARGIVSAASSMHNVIYLQFDPFYIPYVPTADNVYKRVSLLIEDLGMSSVVAHENRHYQMLFDTFIEAGRILLTPLEPNGKFKFNEPIDNIRRLSITFGNPLTPVQFLPDFFAVTVTLNGVASTYINFAVEHNVADGEVVIITGFTTANPSVDFAAINAVNAANGNPVSVVDNFTLNITVDISTCTLLATPPSCECYITSRRLFIPIRFVFLV